MLARRTIVSARRYQLVVPREHGAWGILLVPLVTGAIMGLLAGGSTAAFLPFSAAALCLFWLRTPFESWMGTAPVHVRTPDEFTLVRNTALALAATSLAALTVLFWGGRNPALLPIGAVAAVAFAVQILVRRVWRGSRTAAQMVGSAGLTSTAPAAYYVVTGRLDTTAWSLWAANFLFAVNQIHFVQVRIRAAHKAGRREKIAAGRWFLAGQFALVALLAVGVSAGIVAWGAAVAFVPVLFRGFAWFAAKPQALVIHSLGRRELLYACAFGVLLVAGMRWS